MYDSEFTENTRGQSQSCMIHSLQRSSFPPKIVLISIMGKNMLKKHNIMYFLISDTGKSIFNSRSFGIATTLKQLKGE